ncbi:MAG: tetratricopeptide repeat protein, partial [Hyphomicrobiales bacterium]|nr:tetratricopeptide repeat protein [Hyphomicrobiales bacterium]
MLHDRYGNPVTTASPEARDAYVAGVDLFLAGQVGVADAFERAIAADPSFALAHGALA